MNKSKKITLIISIALVSIILLIGVTYALNYTQTSTNQELILGDIWMKYDEVKGLTIEDAVPGSDYSNYFEFTISGKNTYTKKDIYYDFILNRGDLPTNKTEENRIPDKYLKFKLVSVDSSNQETEIFTDKTYASLNNQRIHVETITKNQESEVNRKYRLYMTIDNSLLIGNTSDAVFTFDEWEQAFASIKVNVTGDFTEKEVPLTASETMIKAIADNTDASCNPIVEEDGIIYFSGTNDCVDFNYVWYSGKLWRVTAIYPDGTMKMITEDVITTISYGPDYNFYTNESTSSWIYQWLNEDFLDTLYNYENIIKTDSTWNVTSGDGEVSTKLAETTMVSAKVGLLNSYEYYLSYKNTSYSSGYLNIGYCWWLSNPYNSASESLVWFVINHGVANIITPDGDVSGGRPVVNLQSTIQLAGGSGIKTDPYRIKGDKEDAEPNTTLLKTRTSGEYVNFDGELYRIVEIENDTTKINKVDYVRDESDTIITKYLASSVPFGKDTNTQNEDYWDYYLNNTWYNNISSNYKSMLEKGTYYLGIVGSSARNYKLATCATANNTITAKDCTKTSTTYTGYVGLPRYGEMFSSQLGSGYSSSSDMWLITPFNTSSVWGVGNYGLASHYTLSSYTNGSRPSLNLKSEIVIKSGSGTEQDPFEVGFAS